jgi:hypothetical protein
MASRDSLPRPGRRAATVARGVSRFSIGGPSSAAMSAARGGRPAWQATAKPRMPWRWRAANASSLPDSAGTRLPSSMRHSPASSPPLPSCSARSVKPTPSSGMLPHPSRTRP